MPQAPHVPTLNPDTLSDILHELRNPLSTVAAHAETLVEGIYGPLSPGQSGALHSMRQQLAHALLLLDDLAKIWLPDDTESTTAGETECDPVALCRQALDQSATVIASRDLLETRYFDLMARYSEDNPPQRPAHWGGYLLRPAQIEFWQGGPHRLHDRLCYLRQDAGEWEIERLSP